LTQVNAAFVYPRILASRGWVHGIGCQPFGRPNQKRGATMYPDLRLCHRNEQKLESGLAAGAHIADEIGDGG